jgi:hypothetical protein
MVDPVKAPVANVAAKLEAAATAVAAKDEKAEQKALPAMAQPTVNLLVDLRHIMAVDCRDTGVSISQRCNLLLIDYATSIGKIDATKAAALKVEATTVKRGGGAGAYKEKVVTLEGDVDKLKAEKEALLKQLAELKAAKK